MRKVELSLKENQKYQIIKKLVETNGNKERARMKGRKNDGVRRTNFKNHSCTLTPKNNPIKPNF